MCSALPSRLKQEGLQRGFSHAYLLAGAAEVTLPLGTALAAAMLCTADGALRPCGVCPSCRKVFSALHPDVSVLEDGSVASIRRMRQDAYIRPNEGARKVYLVARAQELNLSAQNAMLKLLEDGPAYASFLLLCENPSALLPTVRSRCETVYAQEAAEEAEDEELSTAADTLYFRLLSARESELLSFCILLEKWPRERLVLLLRAVHTRLADALVEEHTRGLPGARPVRELCALSRLLLRLQGALRYNLGAGHLAGWLCAAAGPAETGQT